MKDAGAAAYGLCLRLKEGGMFMKKQIMLLLLLMVLTPQAAMMEAADGYDLYQSYRKRYHSPMLWEQSVWVEFDREMDAAEATDFDSRMLQSMEYPPEKEAKLSREEAAAIACLDSGVPQEDAISCVLIGAQPNPVWKLRLCSPSADVDRLVEVDAMTGEVLDREEYKADNYAFDNPIKMYTLHRAYAPAAIEEYGLAYMSAVELSKRYGDMRLDDPVLPVLDDERYAVWVQEKTVTFKALSDGEPSYRVVYDEGGMVKSAERIEQ